jgi:hypothetical protein
MGDKEWMLEVSFENIIDTYLGCGHVDEDLRGSKRAVEFHPCSRSAR